MRGAGRKLGPVAGRIVAEVILGLLQLDQASYWNAPTPFAPVGGPTFRMGDLLKLAKAPIFDPQTNLPIAWPTVHHRHRRGGTARPACSFSDPDP